MVVKTEILNVRIPNELILELDKLVQKKQYNSRSEAIREFARKYVEENAKTKGEGK